MEHEVTCFVDDIDVVDEIESLSEVYECKDD